MKKLYLAPLTLFVLVVFLSVDVVAQRGREQRGNQQRNGNQAVNRQLNQPGTGQQLQPGQNRQAGQANRNGNQGNQGSNGNELSADEKQGLVFMREEEKLARDVYTALHAKWGENVFANIARAESQHMAAVGNLLSRYGIPDPILNNAPGKFTNAQFQQLYTTLVAAGSQSREDALKVGLKIEEMDIADLRTAIKNTNNQDIQRVLENLLRGSRNHLRAFASRLNAIGGTYVATSLPQADFNQIASSEQESGGNNGQQGRRGNLQNGQGQTGPGAGQSGQQNRGKGKGRGNRKS